MRVDVPGQARMMPERLKSRGAAGRPRLTEKEHLMTRTSTACLVLVGCLALVACGGSNTPPPMDPLGASATGNTTPESGAMPADSAAPADDAPPPAPESPPGAGTPAPNLK